MSKNYLKALNLIKQGRGLLKPVLEIIRKHKLSKESLKEAAKELQE